MKNVTSKEIDDILHDMATSDWDAGAEILAQGHPIVYVEDDTPEGHVLKEYPNGRIELIKVDMQNDNDEIIKVIKDGK
ncbi:MAG: hypothetical protein LBG21_01080 [Campylobacteraceae bacterium]|jgi:hypothetical protein|nr:hypothetical protein [Campylobacteraceae bacterium]